jgi:hypothetical protein
MPKDPHIFSSVEEAVSILKNYKYRIEKDRYENMDDLIRRSVSSNIFRAFHKMDDDPSKVYRAWCYRHKNKIIRELNRIKSQKEFNRKLFSWFDSFIAYWNSRNSASEQKIGYGPASKMINLFLKALAMSDYINNDKVIGYFHVPLDYFALKPLRLVINELTDVNYKISIPNKATMSYITTPDLYNILQNAIFKLCKKAQIAPILYDFWAWNKTH